MAFERKKKREQDRHPLFAEEIAAGQTSWEQEAIRRELASIRTEQEWRNRVAGWWRKGRRMYFAAPAEIRQKISAYWNAWTGPADATYFIYVVELHNGDMAARNEILKVRDKASRKKALAEFRASQTVPLELEQA